MLCLPLGGGLAVTGGSSRMLSAFPQKAMRGPYLLHIIPTEGLEASILIERFTVGNTTPFLAPGRVPLLAMVERDPRSRGMVPIALDLPPLMPGGSVDLHVQNTHYNAIDVAAVFWGFDFEQPLPFPFGGGGSGASGSTGRRITSTLDGHVASAMVEHFGGGGGLADRAEWRAELEAERVKVRCLSKEVEAWKAECDRAALEAEAERRKAQQLERALRGESEPFEPGEAWATAADES
jgi:hypothetical protein